MLCPKCKVECRIGKSYYVTRDDDTPERKTRLYMVHEMVCRNPQCPDFNAVVEKVENEQPLFFGEEAPAEG